MNGDHGWRTRLPGHPPSAWLADAQALVLKGDMHEARKLLQAGHAAHPVAHDLSLALAGLYLDAQRPVDAEVLLRNTLSAAPTHLEAAFALAHALRTQGRLTQLARELNNALSRHPLTPDLAIRAIEALDNADRKTEALGICEQALDRVDGNEPRLHAYAGMLALQLGQFESARRHYEAVVAQAGAQQAWEWRVADGMSQLQRYTNPAHPDLARFRHALHGHDLAGPTRTGVLFALGKAHDELGGHATAAALWREANVSAHHRSRWSRKHWRHLIDARLRAAPPPNRSIHPRGWSPLFLVGVPRSGTTLLAQQLAALPGIVQRGELRWLADSATSLPVHRPPSLEELERAALSYERQLRQDDEPAAEWYVDKQPLNLLHIDLILSLWPDARIIYCQRAAPDTALSLWTQCFGDPAHDYAYDFGDIAAVLQGCERLMQHWQARYPEAIRTVAYEALVQSPQIEIAGIARWLRLSPAMAAPVHESTAAISTASLWQARQPVYRSSVGRWKTYAPYLPELRRFDI